ncbi:MAG: sigma factor [Polyangiaceae bacterium]
MSTARRAIETVWRLEAPRLIGGLTRVVRDLALAEDLAHDALLAAVEQWPHEGIPENPGAWLMAAARHRAVDALRRGRMLDEKHATLQAETPRVVLPAELADGGDDTLRLVFIACHPLLAREARVALTLRLVAGLTVPGNRTRVSGQRGYRRAARRAREAHRRRSTRTVRDAHGVGSRRAPALRARRAVPGIQRGLRRLTR